MLNKEDINNFLSKTKKINSKEDIYNYGVMLYELFIGPLKTNSHIVVPDYVNPILKDFLYKCLENDDANRWSAEQLLSHPFLSQQPSGLDLLENENIEYKVERSFSHSSRLTSEFIILRSLGKGGFGHVWKVQNKLDSRIYALKRIPLNPHDKELNDKIKREVKLLSRLSHENVIRYYNSWIEALSDMQQNFQSDAYKLVKTNMLDKNSLCQSYSSVCWDINDEHFSSGDEDYDNNNDSVVFLHEKNTSILSDSSTPKIQRLNLNEIRSPKMKNFMYIQMEYCENSTLRTAIDTGLHKNVERLWRLFKEIVEGLHYIHHQGVIHRDLKPVNIFLDSNDHVKIGDFGLATDVISKPVAPITTLSEIKTESCSNIHYVSQTGEIGTAYYVAPELAGCDKVHYNQKVDIYSLGIIFFEMCFPPPLTFMERNIILTDLRKKDITLPDKAYEVLTDDMIHVIIWLLQHDVSKTPSSAELKASKYLSPSPTSENEYFIVNTSIIAFTAEVN